ncbi:MAG: protoporphyrinogen oxidase [Bacteroidetes bacterium]|nr:protoporphyrinogen oxidase [Bacteroidota bacterium]
MNIGILGAGLAGLSAAYELAKRGVTVQVYERSHHVGGNVRTRQVQGYLVEEGPATIALGEGTLKALIEELGLTEALIGQQPAAYKRYLLRKGRLRSVSPRNLLFSGKILPLAARWRLLHEPWVRTSPLAEEESLAHFVSRRLGPGCLPLADAFVSGIYAGDIHRLSVQQAFPRLAEMEQRHGSLFKAVRKLPRRQPHSFAAGMQTLPVRLAAQLPLPVRLDTPVAALDHTAAGQWQLLDTDGREIAVHDHVLVTTPLHSAPRLPLGHVYPKVTYAPVTLLALGYTREAVRHPLDGFGFLVPGDEASGLLGVQFISSIFPGRAPQSKVLLGCFVGGSRQPELAALPETELVSCIHRELSGLLGISALPELAHLVRYPAAIPQYNLGYVQVQGALDTLERQLPGLHFAGNYRHGVSVPDTVAGAIHWARGLQVS